MVTLADKHLRVVSNYLDPYLTKKPLDEGKPRIGNDRFEGFVVDFMEALAKKMKFNFTIEGTY